MPACRLPRMPVPTTAHPSGEAMSVKPGPALAVRRPLAVARRLPGPVVGGPVVGRAAG